MDLYVDYSCEENSETGRTKIAVRDFDSTSIRDVKYAIQETIQAPVCDQQLFYQGQLVTDDNMPFSKLYFREGDCFKVQFLAAADITGMRELLDVLKNSAQEIVESLFNRHLPCFNIIEDRRSLRRFHDFYRRLYNSIEELSQSFLLPWKSLKSIAQKHFFVQEGGFEAFLEVFKFSRKQYHEFVEINITATKLIPVPDQLELHFNQSQLTIQMSCLNFLWNFGETPQDRKFLLSRDIFPLTVDALLLQPSPHEYTGDFDIAGMILGINEVAIGCCGGLVEVDSNVQEKVSKMPPLIDKLLFMIDRCQSETAGYSLPSSQLASNTLFYATFNVKSAQPLVECGTVDKMINITRNLLAAYDSDTHLRYYCCLFLARMRSAPLVTLDRDTCNDIDELIEEFLDSHVPDEILKWEEEHLTTWMKLVPVVHLAFAAGKEYYFKRDLTGDDQGSYQISDRQCDSTPQLTGDACFTESKLSKVTTTELGEAKSGDAEKSQSSCSSALLEDSDCRGEKLSDIPKRMEIMSENGDCIITGRKDQFTWPGSTLTQELGIFSLSHILAIKENQKTALSENLLPYLVCLSWYLKCEEREKLRTCLANFENVPLPSLKVAVKSVLSIVYGFEMVFNL